MKEAAFYKKLENGSVECLLCPHGCKLSNGGIGVCGVRSNEASVLVTSNYGKISSIGFDPIEKKPLYHYKPGSHILSVGSYGCNFSCAFCQNHSISKGTPDTVAMTSDDLVSKALELRPKGNIGIAFTYNEPTIWYEYVRECSDKAMEAGLDVVLVTNGYIKEAPFMEIAPYVNAMNIDLKSFSNEFYRKICNGDVESVKRTISLANDCCHVEVATLLIGGYNDNAKELDELTKWIAEINPDIPLHLSRYHPAFHFKAPATSIDTMMKCLEIAERNLKHVYLGNVWEKESNTYCKRCGEKLITRSGYEIDVMIASNECPRCGDRINIVL